MNSVPSYVSISWSRDELTIIDQTLLPEKEVYLELTSHRQVWDAIKKLKVRGAPAIGIAGAYGLYLGISPLPENDPALFLHQAEEIASYLNSSRPTAVNLSWALDKIVHKLMRASDLPVATLKKLALQTAMEIHEEDRQLCKRIGESGVALIPDAARILTHCNTGSLATAEFGTAFSVILHAFRQHKLNHVWVDETRPLLQGARLTAWELKKAGIPFSLNIDSAAGFLMQQGEVDLVITGADRIAANGDTANKIGTYSLAVLANRHRIPFYVAAPYSTIDLQIENGNNIEIEMRSADEVSHFGEKKTAPEGIDVYNPAFDITPGELITAIITERGILKPDYSKSIQTYFG
ncbi:MAG: S-methyl-5-thioribose-1-phosphate isomerase [Balneolaceae bacterium]|nr:MAG: S-methyl-5-thioribose-1-phosphate isomerase [Balneolaceae bacterium]